MPRKGVYQKSGQMLKKNCNTNPLFWDIICFLVLISSVISNPAFKIIQTDTSSVILRKHPRFSLYKKLVVKKHKNSNFTSKFRICYLNPKIAKLIKYCIQEQSQQISQLYYLIKTNSKFNFGENLTISHINNKIFLQNQLRMERTKAGVGGSQHPPDHIGY